MSHDQYVYFADYKKYNFNNNFIKSKWCHNIGVSGKALSFITRLKFCSNASEKNSTRLLPFGHLAHITYL